MAADAFGNALATEVVSHYSKPADFRALDKEQRKRVLSLAERAGVSINDPEALKTLVRASETFADFTKKDAFSTVELKERTKDYLRLAGASDEEANAALQMYDKHKIPLGGGVIVTYSLGLFNC